jgi:predicted regulator of Ras-like GTPase activity (Roadblock/LC7/MglB family)
VVGVGMASENGQAISPLRAVLMDLTKIEGVVAAALISKDGLVMDMVNAGGTPIDAESLAALVTTLHNTGVRLGQELNLGEVNNVILEYENYYIIVEDVGEALTALVADRKAVLGRLRYELRKYKEKIQNIL